MLVEKTRANGCRRIAGRSSRCSSSRATTTACSARRAATANCRPGLPIRDYRTEVPVPFPSADVDASHPDILVDHNRCILCARCIRASRDLDGKNVFQFVGRGIHKRVAVNADARLAGTNLESRGQGRRRVPGRAPSSRSAPATPYPSAAFVRSGADRLGNRNHAPRALKRRSLSHGQTQDRDHVAGGLLRVPYVAAGHRRPHPASWWSWSISTSRPSTTSRVRRPVAVGLIEGRLLQRGERQVLQDFREHCDILISVGDCAIMGGIPAMRNGIPLQECSTRPIATVRRCTTPTADPQRSRIAAAAQQGLSLSRGGQDRLPPAGVPAVGGYLVGGAVALLTDKPVACRTN
jgi:ferredoxin